MEDSIPIDRAGEVLVLDSSTFIEEAGLTSKGASALKHYLYRRGTQLVVLQVVAEECESKLAEIAKGKKQKAEECLGWLARFCDGVGGWRAPSDDEIEERAKVVAIAKHLGAIVIPEAEVVQKRAESRYRAERPPGHRRSARGDCRIWEQCLDLLADHDVVFVSKDRDFCGHRMRDDLHPQLQAEADDVGAGRSLTFHRNMKCLLSVLRSEISAKPVKVVFAFIYDSIVSDRLELESNSGCMSKADGSIEQTLLTTDQADVIEVRLEVDDQWESPDGSSVCDFRLRGSCHYRLSDDRLCNLTVWSMNLLTTQPDGSVRAVKGSYTRIRAHGYAGPPPIEPEPEVLP